MSKDITEEGAWIFLSHSHRDLEEVRLVRNELEQKGHNPLMFFLKCLNDDSELDDLIKREIEARTWFLLCDSPNARRSRWVQKEIEMIMSLEGKVYKTINLEDDFEEQLKEIQALEKRATIFFSYSFRDKEIALVIWDKLLENDFGVFQPDEFADIKTEFTRGLIEASKKGFFLVLLGSMTKYPNISERIKDEVDYARSLSFQKNIIAIMTEEQSEDFKNVFSKIFDFTEGTLEDNMAKLIEYLKTVKMD